MIASRGLVFESMLLMRDGYITPVEVIVDAEQRRVLVIFFPNGAKTRCNQEEKENKAHGDAGQIPTAWIRLDKIT